MTTISLPPKGNDAKVLGAYFSPLKVEALATPTMQVKVAEGAFWTADNEHQEFIGGTSPTLSAPGSDAKWVLLTVTPNGALNLVDGTAGTNPELPAVSLYKDELPLSAIFVGDTVTAITNDMIYDIRPMWQIPPDSVSQTQLNDFATITFVNNGLATKAATDGTAEANFTLNVGGGSINDSGIYVDRQGGPDVAIRFNELAVSGSPAVVTPQWEFTNDGATWNAIGVSEGNYYLKTELNSGALDFLYFQRNELTGAPASGALDTRYYEQADVDAAFSALGHTHPVGEITGLNAQVETVNLIAPVSGDVSLYLNDILDVFDTASTTKHVMVYDGTAKWRTRSLNTDDLSDVDTTAAAPVVGDFLINNGGTFVNRPLLTADISDFTDANYVLITTDQNINGVKTFKDGIAVETILTVGDPLIDINFGETGDGVGDGSGTSGIRVDRGFGVGGSPGVANNPAIFQWDENAGQWEAGIEGSLATVLTSTHTHTVSDITDFSTGVTAQLNINNLNQTADVVYAGLADKDHLSYNIDGQWENQPFSVDVTTELNANDLEELQDVSYAGVSSGEVLMWTGAAWANHLPVKADVSDFVEADYLHVTGDEVKTGNLTITGDFITNAGAGTVTHLKSEHTYITDSTVIFNDGEAGPGVGGGNGTAGIEVDRGASDNATLLWNDNPGTWTFSTGAGEAQTINTMEAVGHTHVVADVTDITVSPAEINYLDGTTSDVQTQLDDKISRAGDAMVAGVNLTFSATGEVLGLPAVPSATAASSKEYVDAQITATGGDLTTHAADMTVHLTADQNTLLDGLSLGSPSALSSDDINQLIGISGNVQVLLDGKTSVLAGVPASNNNMASWDATGKILLDSGVRVLDSATGTEILWTSTKIDATKANLVSGVANNFAKLDGSGQLVDSTIRLLDVGTAVTDIWSASKIDTTKADKILPAANNNLATLDATGNLGDSGVLVDDATNTTAVIWTADKIDTTKADKVVGIVNNFITLDASSELQDSGLILNDAGTAVTDLWSADQIDTTKMDKVGGAAVGNFAAFDATGNVVDSGSTTATFASAVHTHVATDVTDFTAAADARIAAASIADLADVLITPSANDLLQWNGAAWVNGTVANIVGTDFVLKSGDTISGDLLIAGDLTVNGTTTILDTINLEVTDKNITLNAGYAGPTSGSTNSGLHVNRNDAGSPALIDLATLIWNDAIERWEAGLDGAEKTLAVEGTTVAQPLYEMQQALEGSPLGSPTTTIAVFTLGFGVPTPAAGTTGIQVFVNGVKQIEGAGKAYTVDYTNPSATEVTFNSGQEPTVAADVEFYGFGYIT